MWEWGGSYCSPHQAVLPEGLGSLRHEGRCGKSEGKGVGGERSAPAPAQETERLSAQTTVQASRSPLAGEAGPAGGAGLAGPGVDPGGAWVQQTGDSAGTTWSPSGARSSAKSRGPGGGVASEPRQPALSFHESPGRGQAFGQAKRLCQWRCPGVPRSAARRAGRKQLSAGPRRGGVAMRGRAVSSGGRCPRAGRGSSAA